MEKLSKKLEELEKFAATKLDNKINPKEEVLYNLIQLLDLRDEQEIFEESFERIAKKVGSQIVTNKALYEDCILLVLPIIEILTEIVFINSITEESVNRILNEIGEFFINELSDDEFTNIVNKMIQKMKILSKNEEIANNDEISFLITPFTKDDFIDKFLQQDKKKIISTILGTTLSLIPIVSTLKLENIDDINMELMEEVSMLEEKLETNLKRASLKEKIYNPDELKYSLGEKPICNLCGKEYAVTGIKRHLNSCIKKHCTNPKEELLYLIIKSDDPNYFLHILVKSYARLEDLDRYIRDVWVDCCGHMSAFYIKRNELDSYMSVGEVFSLSPKIEYIYDFGTSTYLYIEHVKTFKGEQENLIKTLSRNPMPKLKCSSCGSEEVVAVCSICLYEGTGNLCKKCLPKHKCGLEMVLPYVNSPRYGECGYGNWNDTQGFSEEEFDKIYDEVEKDV